MMRAGGRVMTLVLGHFPDLIPIAAQELGSLLVVNDEMLDPTEVALVDYLLIASFDRRELVGEILRPLRDAGRISRIVSYWELSLDLAADVADELSLPGFSAGSSRLTRDKLAMRKQLSERGTPGNIPYREVETWSDVVAAAKLLGLPMIVKPRDGSASVDIRYVGHDRDLQRFAKDQGVAWRNCIAEKFIPGTEVSVEAISFEGRHDILAITDKVTSGPPHFVEVGHFQPSALPMDQQTEIRRSVERFLRDLDHTYGPTHTEVRLNEEGCWIIESHTRPGGDYIHELTRQSTGVDLIRESLRYLVTNRAPDIRCNVVRHAGIRFFHFGVGKLQALEGPERWCSQPGYVRHRIKVVPGDYLKPLIDSTRRHGHLLVTAESRKGVCDALDRLESMLEVQVTRG